jgi:hypothetical protein
MFLFIVGFAGFALGIWIALIVLERRRRKLREDGEALTQERSRIESERRLAADELKRAADTLHRATERTAILKAERQTLIQEKTAFDSRSVTLRELENENQLLKRDLANLGVSLRKSGIDREQQDERQRTLDTRGRQLAERYLKDVEKSVGATINANNYQACKQRLAKAIEWVREVGFEVMPERETALLEDLKHDYELAVRAALEREEQARIKAQIREEQQREREIQRELQALDRERAAIQAALTKALAESADAHGAEIDRLKQRLADAEARAQKTIAQAQITKAGHIYVISNVGSFGEKVFKIGMTRRLDPAERIAELSDASVPFPFDVHMMIACPDAPALENALHRAFHRVRVNKVNPRKEFFKVDLAEVRQFVESRQGKVRFVADAEALEYRQTLEMSEEDQKYIEQVFETVESRLHITPSDD